MNLAKLIKSTGKRVLRKLGWELQKIPKRDNDSLKEPTLIIDDPLEALLLRQAGKQVAFNCPVKLCRSGLGFGYGFNQWHPFVATLRQYEQNSNLQYNDSILKCYYDLWKPSNAAEAFAGFNQAPQGFLQLPPYCALLLPWKSRTPESLAANLTRWNKIDYREHGRPDLQWDKDGLNLFGPVSDELGRFEFSRLRKIYDRLKAEGYDRHHGDIGVMMVRKNKDYRFLNASGGNHRCAALAALGYKTFPAQFKASHFIADKKDVTRWPQVLSGLWTEQSALAYVEHLFCFDSSSWAQDKGLQKI